MAKLHKVIPKFCQIKLPKTYHEKEKLKVQMYLLKNAQRNNYKKLTMLKTKLKYMHRFLLGKLHTLEYESLIKNIEERIHFENCESDQKRRRKLAYLIQQKKKNTNTNKQHTIIKFPQRFTNLSKMKLEPEEVLLLNKGHTFGVSNNHKLPYICIDIEAQITNHPKKDNIRKDLEETLNKHKACKGKSLIKRVQQNY